MSVTLKQQPIPADHPLMSLDCEYRRVYRGRVHGTSYSVIQTRDRIGEAEPRWHISVAGEKDVPDWADLVAIAHELRPGVVFALGLPPRSWWLNVHPHCLHLWELRDEYLIAQWRREGRGDRPT